MDKESSLQKLRVMVEDMFKDAKEKEVIEKSVELNNAINEAELENKQLLDRNAELLKSYKDLVQHTSFDEKPAMQDIPTASAPSFEDMLAKFSAK
jgi:hypothetical protein